MGYTFHAERARHIMHMLVTVSALASPTARKPFRVELLSGYIAARLRRRSEPSFDVFFSVPCRGDTFHVKRPRHTCVKVSASVSPLKVRLPEGGKPSKVYRGATPSKAGAKF